uniref:Protein arginine methyltransferase NDUFAF7 n=2 Tax=Poeciliopsis prolifica TaxID=188132 RepID=A0A0S7EH93_9TELE
MKVCQQLLSRAFSHRAAFRTGSVTPDTGRWRCAPAAPLCSSSAQDRKSRPSMLKHLSAKIRSTGPISVSEYMREVLTNPVAGYYVRKMMLGPEGDFITSPEISQVFGELLGVWMVSEWMAAGRPRRLQLVELGPGKGSLMADVLRVRPNLWFRRFWLVLAG